MTQTRRDVLVISLGGLAAFIHAMPAMASVRVAHRGARITLLTDGAVQVLAVDAPYFDDVVTFDALEAGRGLSHLAQVIKRAKFAMIYDFDRNKITERLFAAMRPFPPAWCGGAPGGKFQYAPDGHIHPIDAALAQIAVAGVPPTGAPVPSVDWAATARRGAPSLTPAHFSLPAPFVVLAPSVVGDAEAGLWPAARFGGLAVRLVEAGVGVAVVADRDDRAAAHAASRAHPAVRDLSARADLTQVAAIARHAAAAFGHAGSGMTHLFAAAGAPTICLYGARADAAAAPPRGPSVMMLTADSSDCVDIDYVVSLFGVYAGLDATGRASPAAPRRANA